MTQWLHFQVDSKEEAESDSKRKRKNTPKKPDRSAQSDKSKSADESKEDGELSDEDDDGDIVTESVIRSPPRLYGRRITSTDDENSSSAFSESDRYSGILPTLYVQYST